MEELDVRAHAERQKTQINARAKMVVFIAPDATVRNYAPASREQGGVEVGAKTKDLMIEVEKVDVIMA
jgi:hypothetical protein